MVRVRVITHQDENQMKVKKSTSERIDMVTSNNPLQMKINFCFLLQPPPIGTLHKDPPFVQYLLQVLQKFLG